MKKRIVIVVIAFIILLFTGIIIFNANTDVKSIKNDKELLNIYKHYEYNEMTLLQRLITLPFSALIPDTNYTIHDQWNDVGGNDAIVEEYDTNDVKSDRIEKAGGNSTERYSKTNIQVENVDEADIIKTDGDYIYSISNSDVIITNAKDPKQLKIESKINSDNVPVDLILYNDMLVVISNEQNTNGYSWRNNSNTEVSIYNINDKKNPSLEKSFELYEPYKTSRCIDGKLYIFSTGYLRMDGDIVNRKYIEDSVTKKIDFKDIKYLKNNKQDVQTLIANIDLNNIKDVSVSSYLIDVSNAYISTDNIYLMDDTYYGDDIDIKKLFGLKGIIGFFIDIDNSFSGSQKTSIYKFEINKEKGVVFNTHTKVDGRVVNQYSLDEKNNHLRIALNTNDGSRVAILDEKLRLIGETDKVAEGERMYATRFMNNKAYMVTYKNTDPLFVIDLSDEKNPKILGELKIPGYSTYLHPYDDTHLIGIGMDTKEEVTKDYNGRVVSSWTKVIGMKMSLFDVSDVKHPKQIDSVTIGDSRTASAILTNPKALLFSKEKNLLAIPVNNYQSDFEVRFNDDVDQAINSYSNYKRGYIGEGYFVYNVDLKGFKLKGKVIHDENTRYTNQLRGLYIDNNLFTVSNGMIKVNELNKLEEVSYLNLLREGDKKNEEGRE